MCLVCPTIEINVCSAYLQNGLLLFTLNLPCRFKVTNLTFIISSFHFISFFKTLSLSLVISTRYQLYKQYCSQCCRRCFFFFRFILPNGREDHGGDSRGQLITAEQCHTHTLESIDYN